MPSIVMINKKEQLSLSGKNTPSYEPENDPSNEIETLKELNINGVEVQD